jgi:2',3'-cyclic-nucleotide 2'-phosphodiesterase (5'-nucleotidase family)
MKRTVWLGSAILLVAVLVAVAAILFFPRAPVGDTQTGADGTDAGIEKGGTEVGSTEATSVESILILHTNDFHGAVEPQGVEGDGATSDRGGLVNLVSLIEQIRSDDPERTLLLDAGDAFQGTYVSNSTYGSVVMAALNIASYDAWALGNHEFDWGQDPLRARIAQAKFPTLAANLLDARTGETWDAVEPYTIVPVGRARVAILGLTYPDTPAINKAANVEGLEFLEAEETVRRYLPELEEQADLIVVLSHLGYDGDKALARAMDGLDVIVGGHSHTFLERPQVINGTIIVQAGAKGEVLGRLELTVDLANGEVIDYSRGGNLLRVTNDVVVVNQEVQALVSAALDEATETMNQPIGETAVALEPQYAGEFALGNLVVDAMLAADIDGQPADIAMHNTGGIRAGLPRGPVTYGQLYAVLPFDNQLMALDLTGAQVLRILDRSVGSRPGAMLVAGMAFRFDMSKPAGQRILEATVGGDPLDPERVYRVVTIDYLAGGGDGQDTFLQGTGLAYGDDEVWVVAEYIRANSPVHPRAEGRIVGR